MQHERNCSIDIFRYLAALLVVSIHSNLFLDINPMVSYLFAQVLPRIAVPFFFAVSGYFYVAKLEQGTAKLWTYVQRLLIPYGIWSGIYYLADFLSSGQLNLLTILRTFFITSSEPHFWFFPALICWVSIVTLFYRLGWKKLLLPISGLVYTFGCLVHAYYKIGVHIPCVAAFAGLKHWIWLTHFFCLGLPFFVCGQLLQVTKKYWSAFSSRKCSLLCLGALALYLGEVMLLKVADLASSITVTPSLYIFIYFLMVFLLRHPCPGRKMLSQKCCILANFTYYSHSLFLSIITWCNISFCNGMITDTSIFFLVAGLTLLLGLGIYRNKSPKIRLLVT